MSARAHVILRLAAIAWIAVVAAMPSRGAAPKAKLGAAPTATVVHAHGPALARR